MKALVFDEQRESALEYPFLYSYEEEVFNGPPILKFDLIFWDGSRKYLVVEVKHLDWREGQSTHRTDAKAKARKQARAQKIQLARMRGVHEDCIRAGICYNSARLSENGWKLFFEPLDDPPATTLTTLQASAALVDTSMQAPTNFHRWRGESTMTAHPTRSREASDQQRDPARQLDEDSVSGGVGPGLVLGGFLLLGLFLIEQERQRAREEEAKSKRIRVCISIACAAAAIGLAYWF